MSADAQVVDAETDAHAFISKGMIIAPMLALLTKFLAREAELVARLREAA